MDSFLLNKENAEYTTPTYQGPAVGQTVAVAPTYQRPAVGQTLAIEPTYQGTAVGHTVAVAPATSSHIIDVKMLPPYLQTYKAYKANYENALKQANASPELIKSLVSASTSWWGGKGKSKRVKRSGKGTGKGTGKRRVSRGKKHTKRH